MPFTLQSTVGVALAPTYRRVVWALIANSSAMQAFNLQNALGAGNVTAFADGVARPLTINLASSVGARGIVILPTDFAYQLDNPLSELPEETEVRYFVELWPFDESESPPNVDAGEYPEDTGLDEVKALEDLPEDVVHPTEWDRFSLQVVNAEASLPAHFIDLPTV